jgi:hypothetical protein
MTMFNRRRAQSSWTPINWGEFCQKALESANHRYRVQLLSEEAPEKLDALITDLHEKLRKNVREYTEINEELTEALAQRAQRRHSRG